MPWHKQTHCKRGHALADGNLYRSGGRRTCRACARNRGKRRKQSPPKNPRPECALGHPMSGENLYVSPKGWRKCRTCMGQWPAPPGRPPRPLCHRGHPLVRRMSGQTACPTCMRVYQRIRALLLKAIPAGFDVAGFVRRQDSDGWNATQIETRVRALLSKENPWQTARRLNVQVRAALRPALRNRTLWQLRNEEYGPACSSPR